jgi:glyceraldehyde-3-phosphate dehydrogenase (NADP+)
MKVVDEEVFGPVVIIEKVKYFDEVIREINLSRYGLQAGLFTNQLSQMKYAHENLEVGALIINGVPGFRIDTMPYGGVKDSGFGREGVKYAMAEMLEPRLLVY